MGSGRSKAREREDVPKKVLLISSLGFLASFIAFLHKSEWAGLPRVGRTKED